MWLHALVGRFVPPNLPTPISHDPEAKPAAERAPTCSPEELARRRLMFAKAAAKSLSGSSTEARELAARLAREQAAERLQSARAAADAAALAASRDRERPRPKLTNEFDPGPEKPRWSKEGRRAEQPSSDAPPSTIRGNSLGGGDPSLVDDAPRRVRRKLRPWKAPRRKPLEPPSSSAMLEFRRQHAWTPERSRALAVRVKKNDAIIAHPRSAEAAHKRLPLWTQAAVRRALHAFGWTFGDEAARRHVAYWSTLEDFARPRAYVRPRQVGRSSTGATRFRGFSRFGLAVVGWTQQALALTLSGPACTDAGADPIDVKTVQRHTTIAEQFGGLQKVVRNPDAEAELRGRPTDANPRGWPINAYWIPAPGFVKPGFTGRWFDAQGNPLELDVSLELELTPRAKRPRRLREAAQAPPPLAS